MKPELTGILIAFPLMWAVGGFWLALFSAAATMVIFWAIRYAVEKGWIK